MANLLMKGFEIIDNIRNRDANENKPVVDDYLMKKTQTDKASAKKGQKDKYPRFKLQNYKLIAPKRAELDAVKLLNDAKLLKAYFMNEDDSLFVSENYEWKYLHELPRLLWQSERLEEVGDFVLLTPNPDKFQNQSGLDNLMKLNFSDNNGIEYQKAMEQFDLIFSTKYNFRFAKKFMTALREAFEQSLFQLPEDKSKKDRQAEKELKKKEMEAKLKAEKLEKKKEKEQDKYKDVPQQKDQDNRLVTVENNQNPQAAGSPKAGVSPTPKAADKDKAAASETTKSSGAGQGKKKGKAKKNESEEEKARLEAEKKKARKVWRGELYMKPGKDDYPFQWKRNQSQRTSDYITLLRKTLCAVLANQGFLIREVFVDSGQQIALVLTLPDETVKKVSAEMGIMKPVEFGVADLMSLEPVDSKYRPYRLHPVLVDEQMWQNKYMNRSPAPSAEQKQQILAVRKEIVNLLGTDCNMKSIVRMCEGSWFEPKIDDVSKGIYDPAEVSYETWLDYLKYLIELAFHIREIKTFKEKIGFCMETYYGNGKVMNRGNSSRRQLESIEVSKLVNRMVVSAMKLCLKDKPGFKNLWDCAGVKNPMYSFTFMPPNNHQRPNQRRFRELVWTDKTFTYPYDSASFKKAVEAAEQREKDDREGKAEEEPKKDKKKEEIVNPVMYHSLFSKADKLKACRYLFDKVINLNELQEAYESADMLTRDPTAWFSNLTNQKSILFPLHNRRETADYKSHNMFKDIQAAKKLYDQQLASKMRVQYQIEELSKAAEKEREKRREGGKKKEAKKKKIEKKKTTEGGKKEGDADKKEGAEGENKGEDQGENVGDAEEGGGAAEVKLKQPKGSQNGNQANQVKSELLSQNPEKNDKNVKFDVPEGEGVGEEEGFGEPDGDENRNRGTGKQRLIKESGREFELMNNRTTIEEDNKELEEEQKGLEKSVYGMRIIEKTRGFKSLMMSRIAEYYEDVMVEERKEVVKMDDKKKERRDEYHLFETKLGRDYLDTLCKSYKKVKLYYLISDQDLASTIWSTLQQTVSLRAALIPKLKGMNIDDVKSCAETNLNYPLEKSLKLTAIKNLDNLPIDTMVDYYGPKLTLYFALNSYFKDRLFLMSLFGAGMCAFQQYYLKVESEQGTGEKILNGGSVVISTLDNVYLITFSILALIIIVWTRLFEIGWERFQRNFKTKYGGGDESGVKLKYQRAGFKGVMKRSLVVDKVNSIEEDLDQRTFKFWMVTLFLVVYSAATGILSYEILSYKRTAVTNRMIFDQPASQYINFNEIIFNAIEYVRIRVMSTIFKFIITKLQFWMNPKYKQDLEAGLILNLSLYQLFNNSVVVVVVAIENLTAQSIKATDGNGKTYYVPVSKCINGDCPDELSKFVLVYSLLQVIFVLMYKGVAKNLLVAYRILKDKASKRSTKKQLQRAREADQSNKKFGKIPSIANDEPNNDEDGLLNLNEDMRDYSMSMLTRRQRQQQVINGIVGVFYNNPQVLYSNIDQEINKQVTFFQDLDGRDEYDPYLESYLSLFNSYCFSALFSIILPVNILSSWLLCVVEFFIDRKTLLTVSKRATPSDDTDIGIWMDMIKMVSLLSCWTNTFYIGFIVMYNREAYSRLFAYLGASIATTALIWLIKNLAGNFEGASKLLQNRRDFISKFLFSQKKAKSDSKDLKSVEFSKTIFGQVDTRKRVNVWELAADTEAVIREKGIEDQRKIILERVAKSNMLAPDSDFHKESLSKRIGDRKATVAKFGISGIAKAGREKDPQYVRDHIDELIPNNPEEDHHLENFDSNSPPKEIVVPKPGTSNQA